MPKMQLLLVDDEERFLLTTRKILVRKGFDVLTASSGQEAIELLKQHPVQVVILDVKMPGIDGLQTLEEIKRLFPSMEVILLTGHATVPSAVKGMKSGASDYLMKPIDIELLIQKTTEAVQRRHASDNKDIWSPRTTAFGMEEKNK